MAELDGAHPALIARRAAEAQRHDDVKEVVTHLLTRLQIHEGERFTVYDDATGEPIRRGSVVQGHPTIGVGRNLAGRGISKTESRMLLLADVRNSVTEVDATWPWALDMGGPRYSVLVELCFNLGLPTLKTFINTLRAMERGDYAAAADGMLHSKWARQVGRRADRLATIMRTGEWA